MQYLSELFGECYRSDTPSPPPTPIVLPTDYDGRCYCNTDGSCWKWDDEDDSWDPIGVPTPASLYPVLDGPVAAVDNSDITITIINYADFPIGTQFVSMATFGAITSGPNALGELKWTVGDVSVDNDETLTVTATEPGSTSTTNTIIVTIRDVNPTPGTEVEYNDINIPTEFNNLVNADNPGTLDATTVDTTNTILSGAPHAIDRVYISAMVIPHVGETMMTDQGSFIVASVGADGNGDYVEVGVNPATGVVTPLSGIPTTIYHDTHRAISDSISTDPDDSTGINDAIAVVNLTDVIDSSNSSTASRVYVNNQLIDSRVGETYSNQNGESFDVKVVKNDGTIISITDVQTIACGLNHTMVIKNGGEIWGTGYNNYNQQGNGTGDKDTFNRESTLIDDAIAIACGDNHSMIIREGGQVYGCGNGAYGEVGLGSHDISGIPHGTSSAVFTSVGSRGTNATSIACGNRHTMIIKNGGEVYGCGSNLYKQLGKASTTYEPNNTPVNWVFKQEALDITDANALACGVDFSMIIRNSGEVWGTGYNNKGQLGNGGTDNEIEFTQSFNNIADANDISCGHEHTMIIRNNGEVWGTGEGANGRLGTGNNQDKLVFTPTNPLVTDASAISCGEYHTMIIKDNGEVWGTGGNGVGQLGTDDNISVNVFTPTNPLVTNANATSCGSEHTMIIKNGGEVWGTGYNLKGQLGINGTNNKKFFIQENGLMTDASFHPISYFAYYKNYWIEPVVNLLATSTACYPLITFKSNETPLTTSGATIDVPGETITQNFDNAVFNSSPTIIDTIYLPDTVKMTSLKYTPQVI